MNETDFASYVDDNMPYRTVTRAWLYDIIPVVLW